jgi:pilus assembly protein CpaF
MSLADRIPASGSDPNRTSEGADGEVLFAPVSVGSELVRPVLDEVRRRLSEIEGTSAMSAGRLRNTVERELDTVFTDQVVATPLAQQDNVRDAVINQILGFGLLQDLLDDESVSEIMVNGHTNVWVEANGKVVRSPRQFDSEDELLAVINRMVRSTGRRVDQTVPMVDARLPDGSRLNVVLPPLAIDGPSVTIRKFTAKTLTVPDLVATGSLSQEAADFLKVAITRRLNVLVSGGTGTGKTTMLNLLSSFIGRKERVVTAEDAAELILDMPNLVRLETRPASVEGTGEVTIRDLVRNALRMRPDRILVGEVRGAESLDMLQAMNTGHEGSLSTLHANTPRDALRRLETMVMFTGLELPLRAIREQVASAIDLVVQVARDPDGFRYVSVITEVVGIESDVISTADLFHRVRPPGGQQMSARETPLVSTGIRCGAFERRVSAH